MQLTKVCTNPLPNKAAQAAMRLLGLPCFLCYVWCWSEEAWQYLKGVIDSIYCFAHLLYYWIGDAPGKGPSFTLQGVSCVPWCRSRHTRASWPKIQLLLLKISRLLRRALSVRAWPCLPWLEVLPARGSFFQCL